MAIDLQLMKLMAETASRRMLTLIYQESLITGLAGQTGYLRTLQPPTYDSYLQLTSLPECSEFFLWASQRL